MKAPLATLGALALGATCATAGTLDRSNQSSNALFAEPGTTSLTFGHVDPKLRGTDDTGAKYQAGKVYQQVGASHTFAVGENLTFALIVDEPFGADVAYNGDPTVNNLAGTGVDLKSHAFTALARYKLGGRFSVFGGLRAQEVNANIALNGVAYGAAISTRVVAGQAGVEFETLGAALQGDPTAIAALGGLANVGALGAQVQTTAAGFAATSGYSINVNRETGLGYVAGIAYEIPDIALRASLTYNSEVKYSADTTERLLGQVVTGTVDYASPQSINLDFQTGIAPGTLLRAGFRWSQFSVTDLIPDLLQRDLVNLNDTQLYTLGIGRQINDKLAISSTLTYTPSNNDDTVTPLGPTDGRTGISLGARYEEGPLQVSFGINYTKLGDANAGIANRSVAEFRDSDLFAFGLSANLRF